MRTLLATQEQELCRLRHEIQEHHQERSVLRNLQEEVQENHRQRETLLKSHDRALTVLRDEIQEQHCQRDTLLAAQKEEFLRFQNELQERDRLREIEIVQHTAAMEEHLRSELKKVGAHVVTRCQAEKERELAAMVQHDMQHRHTIQTASQAEPARFPAESESPTCQDNQPQTPRQASTAPLPQHA
ncbi:hypothetical protein M404DRAFT_23326 [Pisolithus tinctorius Marx 270]|uniref:Uncharacterized protein n=1 Tax=Pisolithus tinctorius Marx 270 TaxID=870435 RepID=A0A0C3JG58_PISTI|nr:hypothetical protein M404DRAFT_23326 [Pisolithus tinctorius Marx 270]